MSACCVSGCKNQSSTSKLKFYRLPSGSRPFQVNRRRLWLRAIQRVNRSTEELKGNARVCGAHFKSQEASMDHDSPDFVPSVFTCANQKPKKRVKSFHTMRRRTVKVEIEEEEEEETTPPRVDSPVDLQSSVLMEEIQTPSTPSVPQDGETLTAEPETETTPVKSQTTSSPSKASPSFKAPAGIPELDKRIPILLLKHIYRPAGGYQCERCNQSFADVSQLMKHRKVHDEEISFICENCGHHFTSQADFTEHPCESEPSFACNVCDRSFATSPNLKRHKLLHVKDGRKCGLCGVLFCQLHNHVLFLPLAASITEYEEDSATARPRKAVGYLMPGNRVPVKPEPDCDARSDVTVLPGPLSKTPKTPSASRARISSEIHVPAFLKPPFASDLPPPVPTVARRRRPSSPFKLPPPSSPASSALPRPPLHSELPPSLKLFSPLYLTSALLEVKRNYEYILSKPTGVINKNVVKEEQCQLPLDSSR
ncbi:zinc finger protein 568-like [Cebidichthys violaceus]|uniref:zinc finger protein 568-like n=1 Tax=Cebidichthys violaceus TaxID=271503 RepID=UPI0035CA6A23